jgi:hypothetical protein
VPAYQPPDKSQHYRQYE